MTWRPSSSRAAGCSSDDAANAPAGKEWAAAQLPPVEAPVVKLPADQLRQAFKDKHAQLQHRLLAGWSSYSVQEIRNLERELRELERHIRTYPRAAADRRGDGAGLVMANHTCNAWCFDGLHAVLFDTTVSERANLEGIARSMAQMAGGEYTGVSEASPQPQRPGQVTQVGVARARVVAWVRGR